MKRFLWVILAVLLIGGGAIYLYTHKVSAPSGLFVYKDLVKLEIPKPNDLISSPLKVKGEARGFWFFEASFPVRLVDANGNNIPLDPPYVMAAEWMTENYVPFETTHTFAKPQTSTGTLIIQKDNPSGLPEYDDSFSIPVRFAL